MNPARLLVTLLLAGGILSGCGTTSSSPPPSPTAPAYVTAAIEVDSGVTQDPKTGNLGGVAGTRISLSGSKSTSTGGAIKTYRWSVDTRPAGSRATPDSPDSAATDFTPDVAGTYSVTLQATDGGGRSGIIHTPIIVTRHPVSVTVNVNVAVAYTTSPTKVTQAVQVGSYITLDASNSTAAAGRTLKFAWSLMSKPAGSATTLSSTVNPIVNLTADVVGEYDVQVTVTDSLGAKASAEYAFIANPGPSAIVIAGIASTGGLSGNLQAATGYLVMLNGASSVVQPGDSVSYIWNLVKRPNGSAVSLANLTGPNTNFIPDVVGQYIVTLDFEDTTEGLASTYTMTITASRGPVAIISASASPVAVATVPAFVSSTGAKVDLIGDGSYETDGDPLTYAWSLTSKPSGSVAAITNPTHADASITPDVAGTYGIRLLVTDTVSGDAAVSTATMQVGAYLPVAVLAQPQVSVLLGGTVNDSAAQSYDPQGAPLTFSWSISAAPAGSTADISGPADLATVAFTPDVAGTYTLDVAVSNGTLTSEGVLTITAFSASAGTLPLPYQPLEVKYSRATDKLLVISANPNALHIVDLNAVSDTAVPLPAAAKDLGVSPDGTRAAVLHEGWVSVVNLTNGTLLNTWATGGSQTMVVVSNAGLLYLSGQTGGQWVTPGFTVMNAATGATVQTSGAGDVYGTTLGVYADVSNQIFVLSEGLEPAQIYSVTLNSGTGQISGSKGSPYWGDYAMSAPLWLSTDESLLFTASGTYFNTNGITYAGTLSPTGPITSVSDDSAIAEAVALVEVETGPYTFVYNYPAAYNLYSGATLTPQGTVPLPLVTGVQSYGIALFHASNGKHVMVVQTGSNQPNAAGLQYFALLR